MATDEKREFHPPPVPQEGQSPPVPKDKKQKSPKAKTTAHLTIAQVRRTNPIADRYIAFAQTVLRAYEMHGKHPVDFDLICRAFAQDEQVRAGVKQAGSQRSSSISSSVPKAPAERSGEAEVLRALARVLPTLIPNTVGEGPHRKALGNKGNAAHNGLRNEEVRKVAEKIPSRLHRILLKFDHSITEDIKLINSEEGKKKLGEIRQAWGKDETKVRAQLEPYYGDLPILPTISGAKIFLLMKGEKRLLSADQRKSAHELYTWLAANHPEVAHSLSLDSIAKAEGVDMSQVSWPKFPNWGKLAVHLGRSHPRTIACAMREEKDTEGLKAWSGILKDSYFHPILQGVESGEKKEKAPKVKKVKPPPPNGVTSSSPSSSSSSSVSSSAIPVSPSPAGPVPQIAASLPISVPLAPPPHHVSGGSALKPPLPTGEKPHPPTLVPLIAPDASWADAKADPEHHVPAAPSNTQDHPKSGKKDKKEKKKEDAAGH